MSDVNEELVRRYFELKGYFVRTNVLYEFRTSKGMGWSDVDLCVLHPLTSEAAAVEVKGWHMEAITPAYLREQTSRLFHFTRPEADAAIKEILGHSDFGHILVVSRVGERDRARVIELAGQHGVEIIEFADVLNFLVEQTPRNRSAGSESEHLIRLLKIYGVGSFGGPRG